jgi:hypothetical protein
MIKYLGGRMLLTVLQIKTMEISTRLKMLRPSIRTDIFQLTKTQKGTKYGGQK